MCEVCVLCFWENLPGDFSLRGVFYLFLTVPPLPLSYTRGDRDRFPQTNIHPVAGGNSEDITVNVFAFFPPCLDEC